MLLKQIHIILVIVLFSSVITTTPVTNSTETKHTEPTQHVTPFSVNKILPYLNDCDTRKPETLILCPNYYDMQARLNISKIEFNQSVVYDVLNTNDTGAADGFCSELEKKLPEKLATAKNVDNPLNAFTCTKYCIDLIFVETTLKFEKSIKPICKLIYWGWQLLSAHAESPILSPKIETTLSNNNNNSMKNDKKVNTTAKNIELSSKTPVTSKATTQNPEMNKETATEQAAIISQKNAPQSKTAEQNKNNTKAEEKVKSKVVQQQLPDKSDAGLAGDIVMSQEEKSVAESRKTAPYFPDVGNDMIDDGSNLVDTDDYEGEDAPKIPNPPQQTKESPEFVDPETKVEEQHSNSLDKFVDDPGSNFFSYFLFAMFASILLYVAYHNKTKVLALLLEGRRSNGGRNGSRRKHTAAYRKLDTNLEEAITSTPSGRSTQIIY